MHGMPDQEQVYFIFHVVPGVAHNLAVEENWEFCTVVGNRATWRTNFK